MKKRLVKFVAEPYEQGQGKKYSRLSTGTTLAGTALMAYAGRRRAGAVAAGSLLLAGALWERFAVNHAGNRSGKRHRGRRSVAPPPEPRRAAARSEPERQCRSASLGRRS